METGYLQRAYSCAVLSMSRAPCQGPSQVCLVDFSCGVVEEAAVGEERGELEEQFLLGGGVVRKAFVEW